MPTASSDVQDTITNEAEIKKKMAEMYEIVEANLIASGASQKAIYDAHSSKRPEFKTNDVVWLSVPTASKLDYRWEGGWSVVRKGSSGVTYEIKHDNGKQFTLIDYEKCYEATVTLTNSRICFSSTNNPPPTLGLIMIIQSSFFWFD